MGLIKLLVIHDFYMIKFSCALASALVLIIALTPIKDATPKEKFMLCCVVWSVIVGAGLLATALLLAVLKIRVML